MEEEFEENIEDIVSFVRADLLDKAYPQGEEKDE